MTQNNHSNRQILLASRPNGAPTAENFRLENSAMPQIQDGQVLVRTVYLSLDPYMRGRMSDAPSYTPPIALNEVMGGAAVSRVIDSQHDNFVPGDWVLGPTGWQDYCAIDGKLLVKISDDILTHPSLALGVLGMPGFTAYMGLLDIGKPQAGETVVVAAATGPVGSIVGQIAKLHGCRVIGIAGGEEKCNYAVAHFGFDVCLDHHEPHLPERLAGMCSNGIDVYYENVGGKVFDAVLPLLNTKARVPVCGLISQYNATELPEGPDRLPLLLGTLLKKRITMQGFIITDDYGHRYAEFAQQMAQWFNAGKIHFKEDMVEGLEQAPQTLIGLLEGKNFGKVVVRVGNDD